jgi:flavodoxin
MLTVVVYATKFGNTERIAKAIAAGAGSTGQVRVVPVEEAKGALAEQPDLLLVGGPTQRRGLSPELRAFVDTLGPGSLGGVPAATFDTRYRGSTMFMGSAAAEAAKRLGKAGARMTRAPESFFIGRGGPLDRQTLEAGELVRAEIWGRGVAAAAGAGGAS